MKEVQLKHLKAMEEKDTVMGQLAIKIESVLKDKTQVEQVLLKEQ